MSYTYKYPRPAVTVDIIVIKQITQQKNILLIQRKNPPFASFYALPGGFVDKDENLIDAAYRELFEETHIKKITLEQFYAFGDKGRDPRGHNVSVVYYGFLPPENNEAQAGDDAAGLKWFDLNNLPTLGFDHEKIIKQFISSPCLQKNIRAL